MTSSLMRECLLGRYDGDRVVVAVYAVAFGRRGREVRCSSQVIDIGLGDPRFKWWMPEEKKQAVLVGLTCISGDIAKPVPIVVRFSGRWKWEAEKIVKEIKAIGYTNVAIQRGRKTAEIPRRAAP